MDDSEREPVLLLFSVRMPSGQWYLSGYADAYNARAALVPEGPAGDEYNRGYRAGLAGVQRDFFAAISTAPVAIELVEA